METKCILKTSKNFDNVSWMDWEKKVSFDLLPVICITYSSQEYDRSYGGKIDKLTFVLSNLELFPSK